MCAVYFLHAVGSPFHFSVTSRASVDCTVEASETRTQGCGLRPSSLLCLHFRIQPLDPLAASGLKCNVATCSAASPTGPEIDALMRLLDNDLMRYDLHGNAVRELLTQTAIVNTNRLALKCTGIRV